MLCVLLTIETCRTLYHSFSFLASCFSYILEPCQVPSSTWSRSVTCLFRFSVSYLFLTCLVPSLTLSRTISHHNNTNNVDLWSAVPQSQTGLTALYNEIKAGHNNELSKIEMNLKCIIIYTSKPTIHKYTTNIPYIDQPCLVPSCTLSRIFSYLDSYLLVPCLYLPIPSFLEQLSNYKVDSCCVDDHCWTATLSSKVDRPCLVLMPDSVGGP